VQGSGSLRSNSEHDYGNLGGEFQPASGLWQDLNRWVGLDDMCVFDLQLTHHRFHLDLLSLAAVWRAAVQPCTDDLGCGLLA
jgi:hypothetical protein